MYLFVQPLNQTGSGVGSYQSSPPQSTLPAPQDLVEKNINWSLRTIHLEKNCPLKSYKAKEEIAMVYNFPG